MILNNLKLAIADFRLFFYIIASKFVSLFLILKPIIHPAIKVYAGHRIAIINLIGFV